MVRRAGRELRRARVDRLEDGPDAERVPDAADDVLVQVAQSPICASENPCRLAWRSSSGVSSSLSRTSTAISSSRNSWSRYHGSILVASNSSSGVAPARMACMSRPMRSSVGCSTRRSRSARSPTGPAQLNAAPRFSVLRNAFCSASVKLRPRAMASPTLFIVVVSVGSAAGNFSNANRGTLTTT